MPLLRNTMTMAIGLAGAASLSQAPEFAQQYRQRLGGALQELSQVVADFDADAARNGMSRAEALALHLRSPENLFRDRGTRMQRTIERQEVLEGQAAWFASLPPAARPLAIARGYDSALLDGLWRDYEPGLPLTPQGALWAAAGFGLGAVLVILLTMPYQRWRRRRRLAREMRERAAMQEKLSQQRGGESRSAARP
ncbi:MAG: DUF2937 family protein [Mesorhizobium sp.]|nr:DUF2937 family protein [Mesorhizobium sp.]